jgi:hypothetical protein
MSTNAVQSVEHEGRRSRQHIGGFQQRFPDATMERQAESSMA